MFKNSANRRVGSVLDRIGCRGQRNISRTRQGESRRPLRWFKRLVLEELEARHLLSAYVVEHVGDSGPGSLRQAILDANANPGHDEIVFNISGGGQHIIQPLSALPNITDTLAIRGETQPGYSDRPLIAIDGSLIVSGTVSGLRLMAGSDGSSISGLSVTAFQPSLIEIHSNNNLITSNFVGVRLDGSLAYTSDGDGGVIGKRATTGVWIVGGADNQIGAADQGNLISGSYNNVALRDASAVGNRIQGNRIGTNEAGTAAISANYTVDRFSERGILIHQAAGQTIIGGTGSGEGNVVSGHFGSSIDINVSSGGNLIVGNRVGTDADGKARIGNARGVVIISSPDDQIRNNLLSGNVNAIFTQGALTTNTIIQGNLVGTDITGSLVIGNTGHAVFISNDTYGTLIGGALPEQRNVIAGTSGGDAIIMRGSNHRVFGNFIGTDISGLIGLGNSSIGVYLSSASNVQIGSAIPGTGNVIAANGTGISVLSESNFNRIQGNLIGTAVDGVTPLGNSIGIRMRASHNLIGTDGDGVDDELEGNVIAASSNIGIELAALNSESRDNVVAGNLIGTDKWGTTVLANQDGIYIDSIADVRIGGLMTVERNIIAGSTRYGIHLQRQGDKRGVEILGNYIGTDITGTVAMANATAINIDRTAGVVIGSTLEAGRNIISGNQQGIVISGDGADENIIIGNYIGTTPDGQTALGNLQDGVRVSNTARANRIGGSEPGERNIISGNQNGVSLVAARETIIQGNWIGTDVTGNSMLANSSSGVQIVGSAETLVGGNLEGAGNVIAGGARGVYLNATAASSWATTDTIIQGNRIGTNAAGTAAMPNTYGIDVSATSWWWIHDTQVGGTEPEAKNLISGSTLAGIRVRGSRVTGGWIAGNWLGTDVSGQSAISNVRGIVAESSAGGLTVGGPNTGNVISGNSQHGILFTGDGPSTKLQSFTSTAEATNAGWIEFRSRDNRDDFGFSSTNNNGGTSGFEAGGTFARASTGLGESYDPVSYYADTRLGGELSLDNPLQAQGSWIVTEADRWNQNIRLGYFNRAAAETELVGHAVGLVIQEPDPAQGSDGIRARAFVQLPGGAAIFGSLINGSLGLDFGVSYSWRFTYEPSGGTDGHGELLAEVLQAGISLGTSRIELTAELRAAGVALDAFGIQNGGTFARSENPNTVSLFIDSVSYTRYTTSSFAGNRIGTTASGMAALPNGSSGIQLTNVTGAIIGGTHPDLRNVISGNTQYGIIASGGTAHVIQGNYVGTNLHGTAAIPNATGMSTTAAGIWIGSSHTQVGGGTSGAGNVISGNKGYGVRIQGSSATHNRVQGNLIGTNPTGTFAVANDSGVAITGATTSFNIIGVDGDGVNDEFEGNVISGNTSPLTVYTRGVSIDGQGHVVAGNKVGTDITGTYAIPNSFGVRLIGTGHRFGTNADGISDALERNLIAGNINFGLDIAGDAINTVVAGNWIGLNAAGNALGNGGGVVIAASHIGVPRNNLVGTNADGVRDDVERNVISGNRNFGVRFSGTALDETVSDNTVLAGNFIGTDITGTLARPNIKDGVGGAFTNSGDGIQVYYGYTGAVIGGSHPSARNIISGNQGSGIDINASSHNVILGNYIGLNVTGSSALPNLESGVFITSSIPTPDPAEGNQIGGPNSGERNVISGNAQEGAYIRGHRTTNTMFAGNYVGTDATGNVRIANGASGVRIDSGAYSNIIGGSQPGMGNVISGHTTGIWVDGRTATLNDIGIQGNRIGTNAAGTAAIANTTGIYISTDWWPWIHDVTVGGTEPDAGNLISGNTSAGIRVVGARTLGTRIEGNWIGTDVTGQAALPNQRGIVIEESAAGVTIGSIGAGNVISGNSLDGISINGAHDTKFERFNNSAGEAAASGWTEFRSRENRDDFGFSPTNNNGIAQFEAGGRFARASTALGESFDPVSYYADTRLGGTFTLSDPFRAEGSLIVTEEDNWDQNILIGFFDRAAAEAGPAGNGIGLVIHEPSERLGSQGIRAASYVRLPGLPEVLGPRINGSFGLEFGVPYTWRFNYDPQGGINGFGELEVEVFASGVSLGVSRVALTASQRARGMQLDAFGLQNGGYPARSQNPNTVDLFIDNVTYSRFAPNTIVGNTIGTTADGSGVLRNRNGILVTNAPATRIGGSQDGQENLISGNEVNIRLTGSGTHSTLVHGNVIGLDAAGTQAVTNGWLTGTNDFGIYVEGDSHDNRLGGLLPGEGNVISGHWGHGIRINGGAGGNLIEGNRIGTTSDGTGAAENRRGVVIIDAPNTQVTGNLISGNTHFGVEAIGNSQGLVIRGNRVGSNAEGTERVPNNTGIRLNGVTGVIIGGTGEDDGNLISGNSGKGIELVSAHGSVVQGNLIGTDVTGTYALFPDAPIVFGSGWGIYALDTANLLIGGGGSAARNVISGFNNAVVIDGPTSTHNRVQGNYIGTDRTGSEFIGNVVGVNVSYSAGFNIIGTDGDGVSDDLKGNVITVSPGERFGIVLSRNASDNVVAGNRIGTDVTGTVALGAPARVIVRFQGSRNRIGTNADGISDELERNVITGGVFVTLDPLVPSVMDDNVIKGNYIGTDITGTVAFGNATRGISVGFSRAADSPDTEGPRRTIIGGTTEVERNLIAGFTEFGILLDRAVDTVIQGNYIGTDVTGTQSLKNGRGINIYSSPGTIIGGGRPGEGNLISGNDYGIWLMFPQTTGTRIQGNTIGTDITGTQLLANTFHGIAMLSGVSDSIIGVDGDGIDDEREGNLISGNFDTAVLIQGDRNIVAGNLIGTDRSGQQVIGNGNGVRILTGSHNRVGTNADGISDELERNVIAGGTGYGVGIYAAPGVWTPADFNVVTGNYIGTDITGTIPLGNGSHGVVVSFTHGGPADFLAYPTGNIIGGTKEIERNIISANARHAVYLRYAEETIVQNNYIGTDVTGSVAFPNATILPNAAPAVFIEVGKRNQIGGGADGAGNLISGNFGYGVAIHGNGSNDNKVQGNWIGTDATGTVALPNFSGISIGNGLATGNIIGVDGDGIDDEREGNLISGHVSSTTASTYGIQLSSSHNVVAGNWIGTDITGTLAIPNSIGLRISNGSHHRIGTNADGISDHLERNIIAGNLASGLQVASNSTANVIAGNWIGLNKEGNSLGNVGGILIVEDNSGSPSHNRIGSNGDGLHDDAERNIISGNWDYGVRFVRQQTISPIAQNNVLAGNYIGTDPSGTLARPNRRYGTGTAYEASGDGVQVWGGATGAVIGGSLPAQRNVIAGNEGSGIDISESSGAIVVGNYIGTDRSGLVALGNQETGITLRSTSTSRSATLTRIGGSTIQEGNLIAGNVQEGIRLEGSRTFGNTILGNWIGTDVTGRASLGNSGGIHLTLGANQNDVGGSFLGQGNVIGGHSATIGYGIQVSGPQTANNLIQGNFIGTDRLGQAAVPNRNGIIVQQSASTVIGGDLPRQANVIAYNLAAGIRLPDALSASGPTQGNRFYGNQGLAIDVGSSGITLNDPGDSDGFLNFPVLAWALLDGPVLKVAGFARPGAFIDFYLSSPTNNGFGQGQVHLGGFYEGALHDSDLGQGTYGPGPVAGRVLGSDTTNRFLFEIPVFDLVSHGSLITAVAYGSTSEFSNVVLVGDAGSSLAPVIELGGDETLQQGERLQRTGSFMDEDSTSWTATVDYGDGTVMPLPLQGDRTFTLDHLYTQVGTYTVTVTITDNSLAVGQTSFQVTKLNEAPTATFNFFTITSPASEGSVVRLRGEFTDPGLEDIHLVEIDWGDGSPVLVQPVPAGDRTFEATHVYVDDDPSGTSRDVYRVQVTVIDNFGGRDSTPIGLFLVDVINVIPSGLSIVLSSPEINESDFDFTLSGSFVDPGILDTHRVVIDWGDGSPRSEMDLPAGARGFNNINHVFRNNPDTPDSTYWITIEVSDDDEPLNPAQVVVPVIVRNVLPHSIVLNLSETVIDENDTVTLAGSFIDPGILDTHRVRIDWGDGSSVTELSLAAGVTSFAGISHQYRDNPSSGTTFTITVEIIDDDQPDAAVTATQLVTVRNVAPTLLTLSSDIMGVVYEGQSVSIEGSFADVGVRDRHRVLVTWGDGTTSWASVDSTARTFKAMHRYLDDGPSGSAIYATDIRVDVFDQDGDSDVSFLPITLANVAPTVTILPGENSAQSHVELIALVTDPGILDTFEYRWEVFLHGNPFGAIGDQSVYVLDRTGYLNEVFVVRLTVTDDDTGTAQITTALKVGTPQADQIIVTDNDFTALNVARMIVLGLGDNDVIDATAVSAEYTVILDGGAGNDRLFGGSGDDIYILRGGDDMANIALPGDPSPNYAGNDRYYIVPNSTHQVADEEGLNAIDFSLATFGVTFDLGLIDQLQDVDPLGDADTHFVRIAGTFAELVGTNFADLLTADSDATLFGGLGDDILRILRADTSNVTMFGGMGDDTFLIQGMNASGLTIFGDDGADLLIVDVPVIDLIFGGGADDDVLQVLSTGWVTSLTFFGDDGADLLDIQGPVFDLIFTGGADDDILQVLAGGSITNLIYNGDDGADLLIVDAPVFDLIFSGGADDDVLRILSGGEVQRLSFTGDDGADLLIIEGPVFDLVFGGGADDDVLHVLSSGSIQSLVFNGDDGADLLLIEGPVFDLVFGGGADDDVLRVLSVGSVQSLVFNGDDGADLLLIEGPVFDLVFGGGADDDVLRVLSTGAVTSLEFNGEDGADLLIVEGSVFDLVFSGGADNDVLRVLDTASVSSLVFNGDDGTDLLIVDAPVFDLVFGGGADDDVLRVLPGASITSLNFQGDDGADLLIVEAPVFDLVFGGGADDDRLLIRETGLVNSLVFTGDDGTDLLIVAGAVFDLIFTGGADDDVLRVTATGSITNLVFHGDDGADLLIIDGPVFDLIFSGGADDDTLRVLSGGSVNSLNFTGDDGADLLVVDGPVFDLTFSGGADDDALVVLSGPVSHITFYGDVAPALPSSGRDGRDVLLNRASEVESIRFFAGQAGSVLQNEGDGIGSIALLGGEGRDILINYGNEIGELRLDGGNGANTLINVGDNVYSMFISNIPGESNLSNPPALPQPSPSQSPANAGQGTLVNYGSVRTGGEAAIRMIGGDDIDVLQNNGTGYTLIEFYGGDGNDVLQNNADGIRNLHFIGGAGVDVLENNGHRVSGIYFDGGEDRDILVNDGHDVSDIVFASGSGESWLLNTGDRVIHVQLIGGDQRNIMANQGIDVSGFTLLGGAGPDWLVNSGANARDFLLDGGGGDDWFLNLVTASGSRQLQLVSPSGNNRFTNLAGLVNEIRFVGGDGDDFYEDYSWGSSNIEVLFGSGQNSLWLGGGKLSDLHLIGGPRKDLYYLNADYLQNVNIQGQAGNDIVVLNGNYATNIHFIGGLGNDTLAIHGNQAQHIFFDGGEGADRLHVLGDYLNSLTFVGGDGDDAVWLGGSQGRGLLLDGGPGHDTLLIVGNQWDDVTFHGGAGMDTLVSSGNGLGTLRFYGGDGADTLRTQGVGLHRLEFWGGSGSDGLVMNHQGGAGSSVHFSGGDGDDVAILRGQADLIEVNLDEGQDTILIAGAGVMLLDAGLGNDRYIFAGLPIGQVTISEPVPMGEDHSQDWFDFSSWSAGGIVLDLASTERQWLSDSFSLQLTNGSMIENVVGTVWSDSIYGNDRDNWLLGSQYPRADQQPPTVFASRPAQWVLLDFDTYTQVDRGEVQYSIEDRLEIATRIARAYRGDDPDRPWFDVRVTVDRQQIPMGVEFATLYFNRTPSFGRPGGEASEIDFRNNNLGGWGAIQINGLLGGLEFSPGPEDDFMEQLPTEGDLAVKGLKPPATRENIIALSTKIAAHELGHLLGLMHADAFGPIGFGIHAPPGAGLFKPEFPGPAVAYETFDHLIGSPASIGSNRFNDVRDLFFGEREAIKLALAFLTDQQIVQSELPGQRNSIDQSQRIELRGISVPNTLRHGLHFAKEWHVDAIVVAGRIQLQNGVSESDFYSFEGHSGDLLSLEVFAMTMGRYAGDTIDPVLRLYDEHGQLLTYFDGLAENDDQFEGTESRLVDIRLPYTGIYYVEVDTFRRDSNDPVCDPSNPDSPLFIDNRQFLHGDMLARFLDACGDTDTGFYELLIYRFATSVDSINTDLLLGREGVDILETRPYGRFDIEFDLGLDWLGQTNELFERKVTIIDRGGHSWTGMVNYGDGTGWQNLSIDSSGSFDLSHRFSQEGEFHIEVKVVNDDGQQANESISAMVMQTGLGLVFGSARIQIDAEAWNSEYFTSTQRANLTLSVSLDKHGNPGGRLILKIPGKDFEFSADTVEWMRLEGPHAYLSAVGSLNKRSGYRILLGVNDQVGGRARDLVRLRLMSVENNTVLFDTQSNEPDDARPRLPILNGNITVVQNDRVQRQALMTFPGLDGEAWPDRNTTLGRLEQLGKQPETENVSMDMVGVIDPGLHRRDGQIIDVLFGSLWQMGWRDEDSSIWSEVLDDVEHEQRDSSSPFNLLSRVSRSQ
jgi:hypothetical protein